MAFFRKVGDTVGDLVRDLISGAESIAPLKGPLTLEQLIKQQNYAFSNPATGAVISKIEEPTITFIANLIRKSAKPPVAPVALVAAWIKGESLFDPRAVNPNNNKAHPAGDTPYQAFLRTDYGIAQVDGRYMSGHRGMAGILWSEQVKKAYDPEWAVPDLVETIIALMQWAEDITEHDASLLKAVGGDHRIIGANAYNHGEAGTMLMIQRGQALAYGQALIARADLYAKVLI